VRLGQILVAGKRLELKLTLSSGGIVGTTNQISKNFEAIKDRSAR
jgi:hypothetical protein